MYQSQNSPYARRIKIDALLQLKEYAAAANILTDYALDNADNYAAFKYLEISLKQAGLNWFQMSENQVQTLQQIAGQTDLYGADHAALVLNLINQAPISAPSLPLADALQMRQNISYNYTAEGKKLMSLSPNPTENELYVSYSLPENFTQAHIEVYNALGQKVARHALTNNYISRLSCQQYPAGIYLVCLVLEGLTIESQT